MTADDDDAPEESDPEPSSAVLRSSMKRALPPRSSHAVDKRPRIDFFPSPPVLPVVLALQQSQLGRPRHSAPLPPPLVSRPSPSPRLSLPPSTSAGSETVSKKTSPFLPTLAVFLTSLLPSLAALAEPLFNAGVKDFSSLIGFVGLSEDKRKQLLEGMEVTLLQRSLLMAKLKRARESGWKLD